jgi:type IV pilus assembly protein PilC
MFDIPGKSVSFEWEGFDQGGHLHRGEISARTEMLARAELRRMGIRPGILRRPSLLRQLQGQSRIRSADIAIFSRQLATLLGAGVPLVQAFAIIGRGHEQPAMQQLVLGLKHQIEKGQPLADSLARHPQQFDALYCSLVRAGEQAGLLDGMLLNLAEHQEKTESLKKRVHSALTYPALVMLVAVVVSSLLLVMVVPQFESLFHGFGAALPPLTQAVIALSQAMQTLGPLLVIVTVALGYGLVELKRRSEPFNRGLDRALLSLPITGRVLRQAAVARFTRTLSVLMAAGVPLIEALPSVAGACGNRVYADAVHAVRRQIATGSSLQRALRQTGLFPEQVIQMVAVGEESGTLDAMLARVGEFYQVAVDNQVEALSKLVEPLIMALLGTLIGGLVLAMYLPLFKLGGVM